MSEQYEPEQKSSNPILRVNSLSVEYATEDGSVKAVRDVSFDISDGEVLGIVGESGSGKSTLAHAILRYLGPAGNISNGELKYNGESLMDISKKKLRSIRGNQIAHVPQDPNRSLNPSIRTGEQIAEAIRIHQDLTETEVTEKVHQLLQEVRIPDPEFNAEKYPHELSGGMQQRILLAMALACEPELLILDEPTTGLDVTTQAKILELIHELIEVRNTSALLITHDLGVINQIAENVCVMYAGEIMEKGPTSEIFTNPANPYTQGLLAALPNEEAKTELKPIEGMVPDLTHVPNGCIFANRCEFAEEECRSRSINMELVSSDPDHETRCRRWKYAIENPTTGKATEQKKQRIIERDEPIMNAKNVKKFFGEESFFDRFFGNKQPVKAVNGVSIELYESETLGVVGESGCGKSTLGASLLKLLDLTDGTIEYKGENIADLDGSDLKDFRSSTQMVFQNPHSSLNPNYTIGESIERPLKKFGSYTEQERRQRVADLLTQVELDNGYMTRYPKDLSGGEKQRVAIARAFAANPSFVVLDEPVAALDVSVQASLLNLLSKLREEYGSSYIFISHDLSVVNYISDRIAVMYLGKIAEVGATDAIFEPPYHPYTRALLSSIPTADPNNKKDLTTLEGDVPSARDPPTGCPFHTRCPQKIGNICEQEEPELESVMMSDDETHQIACHLDENDMTSVNHGE